VLASIDVLPTLAALVGGQLPKDRAIDGRNAWELISGKDGAKTPHETLFFSKGTALLALRSGDWKLHLTANGLDLTRKEGSPEDPATIPCELYNLKEDISETKNVADQQPQLVARLKALALAHAEDIRRNRRLPFGHKKGKGGPKSQDKPTSPPLER
jgi:arylsulfatase A-like enzyme